MKEKLKNGLIIALIAVIVLGTSCATQKRCSAKFPPEVITVHKDSIVMKDTIIYRAKIVNYYIPADTMYVEKRVEVKETISPIWAQNDYASASAWVDDSKLKLQLIQKEQIIKSIIDSAFREATHWREKYQNDQKTVVVTEKYIPKTYRISFWLWIGVIIASTGYVLLRLFVFKK